MNFTIARFPKPCLISLLSHVFSPQSKDSKKNSLMICPVALWLPVLPLLHVNIFSNSLSKVNFRYASFHITKRKDHLNQILVHSHCWLCVIITFSAISSGVKFQMPWNYFTCHNSDLFFRDTYLKLNHFHNGMALESVIPSLLLSFKLTAKN